RDNIFIYKPPYMGSKEEILGVKEVCEKWQIKGVHQVIDILGLMGDAVDKIPGKMGEKIKAGAESAILSKQLATIITNVPVEFHEENFCIKESNKELLAEVFTELEFKTLGKRILGESFATAAADNGNAQLDLFGNIVAESNL